MAPGDPIIVEHLVDQQRMAPDGEAALPLIQVGATQCNFDRPAVRIKAGEHELGRIGLSASCLRPPPFRLGAAAERLGNLPGNTNDLLARFSECQPQGQQGNAGEQGHIRMGEFGSFEGFSGLALGCFGLLAGLTGLLAGLTGLLLRLLRLLAGLVGLRLSPLRPVAGLLSPLLGLLRLLAGLTGALRGFSRRSGVSRPGGPDGGHARRII